MSCSSKYKLCLISLWGLLMTAATALFAEEPVYRLPPREMIDLVDAPTTPSLSLAPNRQIALLLESPPLPAIAELSQPELRLAGLRIDPATSGPSRAAGYTGMRLLDLRDGSTTPVSGLPDQTRIRHVAWAPDSRHAALTITSSSEITLWLLDIRRAAASKLLPAPLHAALHDAPLVWLPNSTSLLCSLVPAERGAPPAAPSVPGGPLVEENTGTSSPAPTYQDLLKTAYDESLFEYYGHSQLALVDLQGQVTLIGAPALYRRFQPSPDCQYLLLESLQRPYSHLVPLFRFGHRVEIRDLAGRLLRVMADLPAAEEVPIARDAVPIGPRSFGWRADLPNTLFWCEAQDGGDPRRPAAIRDKIWTLAAPFNSDPSRLANLALRCSAIYWGDREMALVQEYGWKSRRTRLWIINPAAPEKEARLFKEYSFEDRYAHPGTPVLTTTAAGTMVLRRGPGRGTLYLQGNGASDAGDLPFLDQYEVASGTSRRLWRCEAPWYEFFIDFLDSKDEKILTRRETVDTPPNYFSRDLRHASLTSLTDFPHPAPQLREIHKELITYSRRDGVTLSATLYTPAGWDRKQGTLPALLWAYPTEFKSATAAAQISDSPYRFIRIAPTSPLFWVLRGYAVIDDPAMPIIGEGEAEPNDTYIEQLTAGAEAVVAELIRRGVADSARIAIGGHSYGAFMTANLLSHTSLFRAGIARSGAYNRTLTPFGFQNEERTLWEAPATYVAMSPFMHADRMNTPLLLIHGEADNNTGTFPLQSERYYAALKGLGKRVRLVILPKESHGYRARESVLHQLWEMDQWLEHWLGPSR